jgi:hypothetical protein
MPKLMRVVCIAILMSSPAVTLAQPPTPPEIVHKVDRGVRRAFTDLDHKVHHRNVATRRHTVHRAPPHRVRALCHDGRVHVGRTRASACAAHGGYVRAS